MLLRNFPLQNGRPRGAEQTKNYVEALSLKRRADDFANKAAEQNQDTADLDQSPDGVALNQTTLYTSTLSPSRVMGVLSLAKGEDGTQEADSMHLTVIPKRENNRTYTLRTEGDVARYTRQYTGQENVTHVVHDTATDTISMFVRDEQGRFPKKS